MNFRANSQEYLKALIRYLTRGRAAPETSVVCIPRKATIKVNMKSAIFIQNNPPFLFLLKLVFPKIDQKYTAITFGNRIYHRGELPADIVEHELVHCRQQGYSVLKAIPWCLRYCFSRRFRLEMELEAYQKQYDFVKHEARDMFKTVRALEQFAADLSGPMYGNLIPYYEAVDKIKCNQSQKQN